MHRRSIGIALLALVIAVGGATAASAQPLQPAAGHRSDAAASTVATRLAALRSSGPGSVARDLAHEPAPGWAGEQVMNREADDWEPAVAADPNAPYVYVLHNRYGGQPACARGCPDPAMILHVSDDNGRTWEPERYLCRCRAVRGRGQFDPLIDVVRDTGDVVAVWMNGFHVFFSRSDDHGATWSDPVSVFDGLRWQDKPNVAVSPDGRDVYVLVNAPTIGDVWAGVSHDGGATWSRVRVTRSDRYFFDYGGVVLPSGRVVFGHISFDYSGPGGAPVGTMWTHIIASDDGGQTWTNDVVDELALGAPCVSAGCRADFYDSGPVLAWTGSDHLVMIYDGATRHFGPQSVYSRSSTDGGRTWTNPVLMSDPSANAAMPAAVGDGSGGARVWFTEQHGRWWQTLYTTSTDLGQTWSDPVRISDARSGAPYKSPKGYLEVYGDYGEIAITNTGQTFAVWGEGTSYAGPGGVWYNRQVSS